MKKNGFSLLEIIIMIVMLFILALIVILQFKKGSKPESEKGQKVPAYQITTLWEDKESGCVEFYVKGLVKDPNTGYVSCLSQARREIEAKGYDVEVMPASYAWDEMQSIWVIAERKK